MRRFSSVLLLAAMVLCCLVGCRQPPLAALAGPTLVVLSDELPAWAGAPIPLRADSALPGSPPLFLYLHPSLDTVGVPWLRRLSHLPTAPWQVEFAQRGRLRGQAIRYVRAERFWPLPPDSATRRPRRWRGYHVALAYPELPAGLGPPGSNAELRAECFSYSQEALLYLWLAPQPAYEALPLAYRRRLTDTLLLRRSWPAHLGLLRLADGRELLSLLKAAQTCDSPRAEFSANLYSSWAGHEAPGQAHYTSPDMVFRPALRQLLTQAVLTLVRDTRRQHHLPPPTAAQTQKFCEQFEPYNFDCFTPHGLLFRYYPAASQFRYGSPLADLLPPDAAPAFQVLLPYRVVAPYTRPVATGATAAKGRR
jgi:hypothetical protein